MKSKTVATFLFFGKKAVSHVADTASIGTNRIIPIKRSKGFKDFNEEGSEADMTCKMKLNQT